MVSIPVLIISVFIWFPTISSIILSFSNWDGIGGIGTIHFIGTPNYHQIATIYPPFWPAFKHNLYWLASSPSSDAVRAAARIPARQADPRHRGSTRASSTCRSSSRPRSSASSGSCFSRRPQGLLNNLFEDPQHGHLIDWLGNPKINLWAILVSAGWRHASYVMIIYLAGLKALDPSLREAAAIDGASDARASSRSSFRR